jgi:hypothetical protein
MPADHTPSSASRLLSEALAHLDVIQPASLRDPIRAILGAGIEVCVRSRSLSGKPVGEALALAEAVVAAGREVSRG